MTVPVEGADRRPARLPVFETRTEATTWEDGLLVGSGRVGAVVFGAADQLTIALSHERFFLPVNPRPRAPQLADAIGRVRRAVLEGRGDEAADLVADAAEGSGYGEGMIWTDPLGLCATLRISTPGPARALRRRVDPEHGEVAVTWVDALGAENTLRAIAPRDEETIWIEVASDRGVAAGLELGIEPDPASMPDTGAPDYSGAVRGTITIDRRDAVLHARTGGDSGEVVTRVRGDLSWTAADGAATAELTVPPAGSARIRIDLTGPGRPQSEEVGPPSADPAWAELRTLQADRHGGLVRASILSLGGARDPDETVEGLWARARDGDLQARRRVVEAAYLTGRSHVIAATGELPPTLQGVWQATFAPAWSADYTMNGNVQNGAIASLIPTGTPELAGSLLNLVLPFLDDYRDNAARIFGAEGMLLPSRMSTHGRANHFAAAYPHQFWTGCGGWVLRFAADLISTTGDRSLVDDRLWQLVEGVLRFAETALVEIDGTAHLVPSYSPENAPAQAGSPLATDATIDIAILRDAARCARVIALARGDHTLDQRWERVVASLPPYRRAADGTLAEWIDPRWPENLAHRHVSQLYPLWYEMDPAFQGASSSAAALREAAAATIAAKIAWRAQDPTAPPGRMEMAFGLVQLGLAAAALGDAEAALTCVEWLAVGHWRPSLTSTHDAGRIFNLDASGGLPAVVAAILLGSTQHTLTVLPALPAEWDEGSVSGLRARGGVVVDELTWDRAGCTLTLRRLPGADWLNPGGRVRLRAPLSFSLSVPAPGDVVALTERPVTLRMTWTR